VLQNRRVLSLKTRRISSSTRFKVMHKACQVSPKRPIFWVVADRGGTYLEADFRALNLHPQCLAKQLHITVVALLLHLLLHQVVMAAEGQATLRPQHHHLRHTVAGCLRRKVLPRRKEGTRRRTRPRMPILPLRVHLSPVLHRRSQAVMTHSLGVHLRFQVLLIHSLEDRLLSRVNTIMVMVVMAGMALLPDHLQVLVGMVRRGPVVQVALEVLLVARRLLVSQALTRIREAHHRISLVLLAKEEVTPITEEEVLAAGSIKFQLY